MSPSCRPHSRKCWCSILLTHHHRPRRCMHGWRRHHSSAIYHAVGARMHDLGWLWVSHELHGWVCMHVGALRHSLYGSIRNSAYACEEFLELQRALFVSRCTGVESSRLHGQYFCHACLKHLQVQSRTHSPSVYLPRVYSLYMTVSKTRRSDG